jgi:ABC-type lipoprotein release transport system permease subunit
MPSRYRSPSGAEDSAATLAAVTGLVAAVTAAASYVPVRRATRVDPAVVLRAD